MTTLIKSYSELKRLETFEERFEYLKLSAQVGIETFGEDRYLNQAFYRSAEWRRIRIHVIARDGGYDLGVEPYEIFEKILIHHMNPMKVEDIQNRSSEILNPEFLISVSHETHNAIHYGTFPRVPKIVVERKPGDTKLW